MFEEKFKLLVWYWRMSQSLHFKDLQLALRWEFNEWFIKMKIQSKVLYYLVVAQLLYPQ